MKYSTYVSMSFLFFALAGTSHSQVPQIEREALLALYNSAGGPSWTEFWEIADTDECTWYGITCNNDSVTSIMLSDNGLNGIIPSELGNLTNLTGLYLIVIPSAAASLLSWGI